MSHIYMLTSNLCKKRSSRWESHWKPLLCNGCFNRVRARNFPHRGPMISRHWPETSGFHLSRRMSPRNVYVALTGNGVACRRWLHHSRRTSKNPCGTFEDKMSSMRGDAMIFSEEVFVVDRSHPRLWGTCGIMMMIIPPNSRTIKIRRCRWRTRPDVAGVLLSIDWYIEVGTGATSGVARWNSRSRRRRLFTYTTQHVTFTAVVFFTQHQYRIILVINLYDFWHYGILQDVKYTRHDTQWSGSHLVETLGTNPTQQSCFRSLLCQSYGCTTIHGPLGSRSTAVASFSVARGFCEDDVVLLPSPHTSILWTEKQPLTKDNARKA